ncbi:MAG TPA: ACT domain-containing protein, partial [Spirochaetales bacterium]|nr:ACT domain-containing protein [Spirochaetales bacterium]
MIASFAGNKVEGLAFAKGLGLLIIPCFVGLTIPAPWHYFGGIFPTYWVTQSVLSDSLVKAGIPIFAISTYNTDYILVKRDKLISAIGA